MSTPPVATQPRRQVLVVDDEPQNLDTFRRVFHRHHEITSASSGAEALARLAQASFDVVLTDYGMPGMNGAQFVARARLVQPVALVMLTGYGDTPEVMALQASGAVFAVIGKPWDRRNVAEVIARASEHTLALRGRQAPP